MAFKKRLMSVIRDPFKIPFHLLRLYGGWIPNKQCVEWEYFFTNHRKLHLDNPVSFNEKLQWLKLYYHKPEFTIMVDKVKAKDYVAEKIGSQYIIPIIGVWEDPDDIDFDKLPDQFVLKCNHGSGENVICKDKSQLDTEKVRKQMRKWLKRSFYKVAREWPYKDVPRRILAEKYMTDNSKTGQKDLRDYKFFCFNGEPKLCEVISDRSTVEKIDFYDMEWNRQKGLIWPIGVCGNSNHNIQCPDSFEELKRLVKVLAKGLPFVRIDFYDINGVPYFGEITFYPHAGYGVFYPYEWNERIGSWIKLPKKSAT